MAGGSFTCLHIFEVGDAHSWKVATVYKNQLSACDEVIRETLLRKRKFEYKYLFTSYYMSYVSIHSAAIVQVYSNASYFILRVS